MTHGWGSKKKHRGAGHRGGRGNAGSGKRGDAKKPVFWKDKNYFGKKGFKKKNPNVIKAIGINLIQERVKDLLEKKLIEKKEGKYLIDLKNLGYNKLIGFGGVKNKFEIKTDYASKGVIEKVKKAGGKVILPVVKQEKPEVSEAQAVEKKPEEKKEE